MYPALFVYMYDNFFFNESSRSYLCLLELEILYMVSVPLASRSRFHSSIPAGMRKRWILVPLPPPPLPRFRFRFHQNVVNSMVALRPTNAGAAYSADRFRYPAVACESKPVAQRQEMVIGTLALLKYSIMAAVK